MVKVKQINIDIDGKIISLTPNQAKEFKKMLKECPVMYYNMIGEDFC